MGTGDSVIRVHFGQWSWGIPKTVIDRLLWGMLFLNVLLMAYYICRGYRSDFHSDSAIKNLLAKEMLDVGGYFPPDWNYVNGDLWIVFGQAFVLPFLPWAKNGYLLHAISGLISAGLILYGVWLVMSLFVESRWVRRIALIAFAGAFSALGAENLYGQVSYGSVLYLSCFTLYLSWRFMESEGRKATLYGALLVVLLVLAFWSNPQRAVAYYFIPTLAAIAVQLFGRARIATPGHTRGVRQSLGLIVLWIAAAASGVVLHSLTLTWATSITGASSAHWLTFDLMVRNFWMSIEGLLAILGGVPTAGKKVMALEGLPEGIRMIVALAALAMIPVAIVTAFRSQQAVRRFIAVYCATGLGLFFFLQVTTTTPDMTDPVTSARYMLPALLMGVMMLIGAMESKAHSMQFRIGAGLVVAVLAIGSVIPPNPLTRAFLGNPVDGRVQMMKFLESQGLEYGYATYWNAGANTVLSQGDVKIRQIIQKDGLVVPYRHLSSNRWYRPDAWSGETFLMLTDEERKSLDWAKVTEYTGLPQRELTYGQFRIYVFSQNIAAVLPFWDNDVVANLLDIQPDHNIGRLEMIDGRESLVSEQGEQGFLHFGPYLSLNDGRYRVSADIDFGSSDAGLIDVVAQRGQMILASQRLVGGEGPHRLRLDFDLPQGVTDLEVRLQSNGTSKLVVRRLTLERTVSAAQAALTSQGATSRG